MAQRNGTDFSANSGFVLDDEGYLFLRQVRSLYRTLPDEDAVRLAREVKEFLSQPLYLTPVHEVSLDDVLQAINLPRYTLEIPDSLRDLVRSLSIEAEAEVGQFGHVPVPAGSEAPSPLEVDSS